MDINNKQDYSFSPWTYEDWIKEAEDTLHGKKVDILMTEVYENFLLKPIYTKQDVKEDISQFPGGGDCRRGINVSGYIGETWKISQDIGTVIHHDIDVKTYLQNGHSSLTFHPSVFHEKKLTGLLSDVYDSFPFSVNGANLYKDILDYLNHFPNSKEVKGFVGKDPVALYAKEPRDQKEVNNEYDQLFQIMNRSNQACPQLKTLLIDTSIYHNAGANAVQELAIGLSTAVFHIEELRSRGMELDQIINNLVFHYSIGSHFFIEIAKLRAARVLWSYLMEAYMLPNQNKLIISAETSLFNKTAHEPYVNMIRSGNEAFAAVLGGIQYLYVRPFNDLEGSTTLSSDRIARNTHFILKDEALLSSVIDPVGGSYFIECLTDELVKKSWSLFLEIDKKGGVLQAINHNWLQELISEVRKKRDLDISTCKHSIIGTNKYVDLTMKRLNIKWKESSKELFSNPAPLLESRLSEPYEKLNNNCVKILVELLKRMEGKRGAET